MFSETDPEITARALCGAYLMVAFADGDFAPIEEGRLMSELAADDAFKHFDKDALRVAMLALMDEFRADYDATALDVLISVHSIKDDEAEKQAVMHVARVAVVADHSISDREEAALTRIADALEIEKGSL